MPQSRLYSNRANNDSDTDTEVTGRYSNRRTGGLTENQKAEDIIAPSEPPPTYEQSLFTSHVPAWFPNPFQRNNRSSTIAQRQEIVEPSPTPSRLTPQNSPSAPPASLMTSNSSLPSPNLSDESPTVPSSALKRGKRPVRDHQSVGSSDDNEEFIFRAQPPVSHHFSDASSPSSPLSTNQRGYFDSLDAQRTARRLEHKQAHAQLAASAPNFNLQDSQDHFENDHLLSKSNHRTIVPAPPSRPSRLLQFRSREPSSVRACPFPLCKKPIRATKIRRQRGAAVWIACGFLFLCNTYWTTQVVVDYFTAPSRDRVLSNEAQNAVAASSSFTASKEAAHLVKGLLGLKSQRYHDPSIIRHQKYLAGINRPTIASVGIITDDQGYWRAILTLLIIATMASVRFFFCLSPLLFEFLFDTVHSCPHPHPYPYPEEIEKERKLLGNFDLEGIRNIVPMAQNKFEAAAQWYGGDEKRRLRERDEKETRSASRSRGRVSDEDVNDLNKPEGKALVQAKSQPAESKPGRFRFFSRLLEIRREAKEKTEQARVLAEAASAQIKKAKLPAAIERTIRLSQFRRNRIIKASQDIGRYSLVYEAEYYILMQWWKQGATPVRGITDSREE